MISYCVTRWLESSPLLQDTSLDRCCATHFVTTWAFRISMKCSMKMTLIARPRSFASTWLDLSCSSFCWTYWLHRFFIAMISTTDSSFSASQVILSSTSVCPFYTFLFPHVISPIHSWTLPRLLLLSARVNKLDCSLVKYLLCYKNKSQIIISIGVKRLAQFHGNNTKRYLVGADRSSSPSCQASCECRRRVTISFLLFSEVCWFVYGDFCVPCRTKVRSLNTPDSSGWSAST